MNRFVTPAIAACVILLTPAAAIELGAVNAEASAVGFVFREMNVPVEGKFRKFTVQLRFDPARPADAQAAITLDLASVDAGSDEANDEVVGKDWFDTKNFPQATFVSSSVKALGSNRYELAGKLTIKGRSQDIIAPVSFTPKGDSASLDGSFVLKRADFSIGERSWAAFDTVANEVQIKFHFVANGKK